MNLKIQATHRDDRWIELTDVRLAHAQHGDTAHVAYLNLEQLSRVCDWGAATVKEAARERARVAGVNADLLSALEAAHAYIERSASFPISEDERILDDRIETAILRARAAGG